MPLKTLLVDDNQTFIAAVRQFLDSLPGLEIVGQASDGKTALAHARGQKIDLVILDIAMPGMNGLELARAIRQTPEAPQLVFLSMHDNQEYRSAAQEMGAGFVGKSEFVDELLPMLARMIEAHSQAEMPQQSDTQAQRNAKG